MKYLITPLFFGFMFSAIVSTQAQETVVVPKTPKPQVITELGVVKAKAVQPVTVFANDPIVLEQLNAAQQANSSPATSNGSQETTANTQVIQLPQPMASQIITNNGPTFIFQDITVRDESDNAVGSTILSDHQRYQQVELIRQSAAASKQN